MGARVFHFRFVSSGVAPATIGPPPGQDCIMQAAMHVPVVRVKAGSVPHHGHPIQTSFSGVAQIGMNGDPLVDGVSLYATFSELVKCKIRC